MTVETPHDGQQFRHGQVYVAPPDFHLIIERGAVRLESSPREAQSRPAIDPLFRSAALAYGRRVVGVILSGMLYDGTAGLWQIKKRGGTTIVQDPFESAFDGMPLSAINNVAVDYCLPVRQIGEKLIEFAQAAPAPPPLSGARTARVLIVEDERIVAWDLETRLTDMNYEVTGAVATGEAAIDFASAQSPDVVLMDIHLAGEVSGTEAARIIWERLQIPVVYVTAYADQDTLDDVKTTEPYGYVVKPFRALEIHAAIQLALDRRDKETRGL